MHFIIYVVGLISTFYSLHLCPCYRKQNFCIHTDLLYGCIPNWVTHIDELCTFQSILHCIFQIDHQSMTMVLVSRWVLCSNVFSLHPRMLECHGSVQPSYKDAPLLHIYMCVIYHLPTLGLKIEFNDSHPVNSDNCLVHVHVWFIT